MSKRSAAQRYLFERFDIAHDGKKTMEYSLLFYSTPEEFAARSDPAGREAFWGAFGPYMTAIQEAGIVRAGAGLQPPETATTLFFDGNEHRVQDGPCPDTKEQLAGLFVIEVPDLDTAMSWAARYPGRAVEVRPVLPPLR